MKKLATLLLTTTLLLTGCGSTQEEVEEPIPDGPIVETDDRTDEEKELAMIQSCISDYNDDHIEEREEYFQMELPPLPLEIQTLPEINSLKDLKSIEPDPNSNKRFIGEQALDHNINAIYSITKPTGGMFWINGSLEFQIDPSNVVENDPQFESVRNTLIDLISHSHDSLNYLYGINVQLGEQEVEPGYYPVLSMDGFKPKSIDDIKAFAEKVYTKEFLEENYYKTSFESETPIYKMINGKLCCVQTGLAPQMNMILCPNYIVAVKDEGDKILVDLLSSIMNQVQPKIYRVTLQKTNDGYRFPAAY